MFDLETVGTCLIFTESFLFCRTLGGIGGCGWGWVGFKGCWSIIFSGIVFRLLGAEIDFFREDLVFSFGEGVLIKYMDGLSGGLLGSGERGASRFLNFSWIRSGLLSYTNLFLFRIPLDIKN